MTRTRKKKHQLLSTVVLGTVVFMMLGMIAGGLAQNILIFMLTGYIAGTEYVVPVWGMFCLYGGIVAFLIMTYAVDKELENKYVKKIRAGGKLPRRRYGQI